MKLKNLVAGLTFAFITCAAVVVADNLALRSQINGTFEQAKQLTSQGKYDEAIVKAEVAITKLKELRNASANVGAPDLAIVSISGNGDQRVTVIVQNKGAGPVPEGRGGNIAGFIAVKVKLYLVPTAGGQPRELDSTGMMILDGLNPGEAKPVRSRAMGCGLTQDIKAVVDSGNGIAETDENNNESQIITVKSRPCGS
ncbi:MAG: CARDB domain-containing protein [Pyrinomonadaceae bacterium]